MGTTEDGKGGSPDKFESVRARVNETLTRVIQIDRQIETMPKDAKPTPVPRPHGWFNNQKHPGNHERNITFLKEEKHRLKSEALKEVEKATQDADGSTRRAVRDDAREKLFPNPYRQMHRDERLQERQTLKDIEKSQDFMDAERLAGPERNNVPEPEKQPVEKQEVRSPASERFSASLQFSKMRDNTRDIVERNPNIEPSPDRG